MEGKGLDEVIQLLFWQPVDPSRRRPSTTGGKLTTECICALSGYQWGAHADQKAAIRAGKQDEMGQFWLLAAEMVGKVSHHTTRPDRLWQKKHPATGATTDRFKLACLDHVLPVALTELAQQGGIAMQEEGIRVLVDLTEHRAWMRQEIIQRKTGTIVGE